MTDCPRSLLSLEWTITESECKKLMKSRNSYYGSLTFYGSLECTTDSKWELGFLVEYNNTLSGLGIEILPIYKGMTEY